MKRIIWGGVAFLLVLTASCSMLDESDYVAYYEIGNVRGESKTDFIIETDAYDILNPIGTLPNDFDFKDGARVLVQFSIEKGDVENKKYDIKLTSIQNLFEKELVKVNAEGADTLKKDPVNIVNAWIGKDYLNIQFNFRSSANEKYPHYFNLVLDSTKQDVDNHIVLDLTHNAGEDLVGPYFLNVIMTVPINELQAAEKDSVNLWFRANDELYKSSSIVYKYNIEK